MYFNFQTNIALCCSQYYSVNKPGVSHWWYRVCFCVFADYLYRP